MIKNVEKLHELGYVHRDIKPDNILVELLKNSRMYDNKVTNTDFEIREQVQRGRLKGNRHHPYHT
jgi:serine/threonine protein kinase